MPDSIPSLVLLNILACGGKAELARRTVLFRRFRWGRSEQIAWQVRWAEWHGLGRRPLDQSARNRAAIVIRLYGAVSFEPTSRFRLAGRFCYL